jgi:hypothetical protein
MYSPAASGQQQQQQQHCLVTACMQTSGAVVGSCTIHALASNRFNFCVRHVVTISLAFCSPPLQGGLDTGSIYPARILDTDAFTSVARPPTAVSIPPRSLELLSLPPRSALDIMGSPGGGGGGSAPVPALVMSVLGSKWTPPLPLPTPPSAAAGGLGSSGGTEGGSEAG